MNAILIIYGGSLESQAFELLYNQENSISLTVQQAQKFPGVNKTVFLFSHGSFPFLNNVQFEQRDTWTVKSLLEKIAQLQSGYDFAYFIFADCPFLDPSLAGAIAERHTRYSAEYSYADGWPYGLAPEILSEGTAAILSKIQLDENEPVNRDVLFSVIRKDINAFDIETEISSVDLRCHRINLCADSKRNLLLLKNFLTAANDIPSASLAEQIIEKQPEILRTLPAFYPVQVYGGCPQKCALCPYPLITDAEQRKDFMDSGKFEILLDKIVSFSEDAVIDLSLWGELSLHPEKMKLIESVIKKNSLALVVETSGLNWSDDELEKCAALVKNTGKRKNSLPPLSWIVSLDTQDSGNYAKLRGNGFAQANNCAKKLLSLFPDDCYVQAVRFAGSEDDTEKFYRYWKETCSDKNIIIQKFDDFCGFLEKKQASDISPVTRQCCWHIMRDMPVLLDGSVPLCREELKTVRLLGNVFVDSLESIWQKGNEYYNGQCSKNYDGLCANCDEYYTYNF
ncbi:MAG: spiro-SPASM protein [Treponema sp.]|nr:spiro-SPASM protein [Treponema sp.]